MFVIIVIFFQATYKSQKGENMVKVAKVKVLFQGLHMKRVISALVYNLNFFILDT
jgi:hypothetical protein